MTRSLAPRHRAGFTLIEALLATALMGAILAALATITAQWLPNWNRGFARVQRAELLPLGLDRLVADLAAAEFIAAGRDLRQADVRRRPSCPSRSCARRSGPNTRPGLGDRAHRRDRRASRDRLLVRTRAPFVPFTANERAAARFADPVVLVRSPYRVTFAYAGADRVWQRYMARLGSIAARRARDGARRRDRAHARSLDRDAGACAGAGRMRAAAALSTECLTNRAQPEGGTQTAPPREL